MTFEVNVFSRSAAEICLHLNLRNRLIRALVCFLPQLPAERRETLGTAWGRLFPPLLTELIRSHRQSAIAAALLKPRGISLQVRSEWVGASLCVWWLQGVVWHHSPYCVHSSSAGSRSLTHSHTHTTPSTHMDLITYVQDFLFLQQMYLKCRFLSFKDWNLFAVFTCLGLCFVNMLC